MPKIKKRIYLVVLLSFGLISWASAGMADDKNTQNLSPAQSELRTRHKSIARDILSDNADQTDSAATDSTDDETANDFDSNKEDQSEEAAPTPQEEEDSPLLDEEGNVIKHGQTLPNTLTPQTPVQNPLDTFSQNVNNNIDK